jgi:anti-sigma B factor antagonist
MSLTVNTEVAERVLMAHLDGDLDRAADEPLAELEAQFGETSGVVLDFTDTGFIASSGLALLVRLVRSASAAGATVAAMGLDEHYRHVFEITRLDSVMFVTEDKEAAVAAVSGGNQ